MSEVQQLFRLQEIDSEILEKKQRLGAVLKAQKQTDEVVKARSRSELAAAQLKHWQVQRQDLNLQLESLASKAKRSENRLYSGKVTNPKELTDLQNEIASLGRRRSVLEDEVLEAMIMLEEAESEVSSADQDLAEVEASWHEAQEELKLEQNTLALRLGDLTTMRQKQVRLVSGPSLATYEKIAKRQAGKAVVRLRGNICQGCQLNVSANILKAVQVGSLVPCPNCGRILSQKW